MATTPLPPNSPPQVEPHRPDAMALQLHLACGRKAEHPCSYQVDKMVIYTPLTILFAFLPLLDTAATVQWCKKLRRCYVAKWACIRCVELDKVSVSVKWPAYHRFKPPPCSYLIT